MNFADHALSLLNWILGLIGTLALMAGLAFLPSLFGKEVAEQSMIEIFEIAFSKNVLGFFSGWWGIGIMVVAIALFTWVCLILSMSTHAMIVSFVHDLTFGDHDAERAAWGIVLLIDLILVALFVFILFGGLLETTSLLIWSLLVAAVAVLLMANYSEQWRA